SKLGSTILISTEQFLSLIYNNLAVSTGGFGVKFHVKCKPCKTVSEFINKSETNFNACVAAAGL
ncbi:11133_t:CDS:1, partial [Entrophospora sp. SA101]